MKFSIITPTFKRPGGLKRAIDSVISQRHDNWEMIIINDSPGESGYDEIRSLPKTDRRFIYLTNEKNSGVNFSRNRGLNMVSADSDRVIFLDDDDYFSIDALSELAQLSNEHTEEKWIVTARGLKDGALLTRAPQGRKHFSYAWDYLIFRKFRGDATHCIETKALGHIRFSKNIKQGEEWIFYFQLGVGGRFFYRDIATTLSDGYDTSAGLNFRKRSKYEQFQTLRILFHEGFSRRIFSPSFAVYMLMRMFKIIFF